MTTPPADDGTPAEVEPLDALDALDAPIEASIDVLASPADVWRVVADPRRIAAASPQVVRTWLTDGPPVRVGTRMYNLNRRGLLLWPTRAKVVVFEPERRFGFRVKDNWSIWSYALEPVDTPLGPGTRLTHRRETPKGISPVSTGLTKTVLGGERAFRDELAAGMKQTLRRLKADIERVG